MAIMGITPWAWDHFLKPLSLMHPQMQVLRSDNKKCELTYPPGKRGDKISHLLSSYFIYTNMKYDELEESR